MDPVTASTDAWPAMIDLDVAAENSAPASNEPHACRTSGRSETPARQPAAARTKPTASPDSQLAQVAADLPDGPLRVEIVRSADELRTHLAAWERLAETALEPNIFYEPTLLLPAWESLARGAQIEVALVYGANRKYPAGPPVLCGLFPLERRRSYHGIPARTVVLWHYVHCFLCTPLVRSDFAAETLTAFLDWLRADPQGAALVQWRLLGTGGRFEQLLVEELHRRERPFWITERHTRAVFRPAADAESYAQAAMPRKRRHELRRLERRLAEQGLLERAYFAAGDDLDCWLDDFLALESSGWKGEHGSALASHAEEAEFFRSAARDAARRGRLMLLALRFEGRAIAMKCNFLTANAGFAFKVAFDETFAQYSPGTLLEMETIARLHERAELTWMDSCAQQDHPMINRLWHERRTLESLWFATGRAPGDLLLACSPLLKWAKRRLATLRPRRSSRTTTAIQESSP